MIIASSNSLVHNYWPKSEAVYIVDKRQARISIIKFLLFNFKRGALLEESFINFEAEQSA